MILHYPFCPRCAGNWRCSKLGSLLHYLKYNMLPREIFFCFRKKSIILRPAVTVKVDGDEILKGQNNMAEEGIGKAADQRLFGAVNDKNNISKPGRAESPRLVKAMIL